MRRLENEGPHSNFEMKVLLMDPSLYPSRLRARSDLRDIKIDTIDMFSMQREEELKEFVAKKRDGKVGIRFGLFNNLPFGPIYVVDDHVFFGSFVSHRDAMDSVCFETTDSSIPGKEIIASFENSWKTRCSEIQPSWERRELRSTIRAEFNAARKMFSNFHLLGSIGPQKPISDDFRACLKYALDGPIQTVVLARHARPLNLMLRGFFLGSFL